MTKLLEWLSWAILACGVWFAMLKSNFFLFEQSRELIFLLPIIFLFLFGLYAVTVVLYRVFTFNTCKSAAFELQQQIEEAKKDLQNKGITLRTAGSS